MLEAKNIRKVYDNGSKEIEVLKGVDLKVEKGEFVAIVGPSGAGKSTLLHVLGGLDAPSSGSVVFKGQDLYKLSDLSLCRIRNKQIGFVFQFYHLLGEFNVLENVLMPALIGSGFQSGAVALKKHARGLIEQAGLTERETHFPNQLSGGEQQRVAIARALINNPEMLFCDEPTGNLDSKTGTEIIGLIRKAARENNTSIVLVTHNMDLARSADKVYDLKDGILVN
ncbi:MAG: ABC transporter ATP-binding protein [Candidatus Omnitrophica bacterium]|nr:ABC transporter ATP-binding protein [Candidatus Omnitrophota bacterium]